MGDLFLGIDFSGAAAPWRPRCAKPTVWIATVGDDRLIDLRPVQDLPGEGAPFHRLVRRLAAGGFRAAGIDAPFSLPGAHLPGGRHASLLKAVNDLPPGVDRPFPTGRQLYDLAASVAPVGSAKPFRETERRCGAAARSTLWNGARPGAPFAAACLTLLARSRAPLWPWTNAPGMLVEVFPMAQLKRWGLPYRAYGKSGQGAAREGIVRGIERRIRLSASLRALMLDSPDALDAVVAVFGAAAAATGRLAAAERPSTWETEGVIAVHD